MSQTNNNFFKQVYRITQQIPKGRVTTYGEIANALGTRDARKVGWALHANRSPQVPCHRVVSKAGRLAKNFAFNGEMEQRLRLEAEGVVFLNNIHVDLKKSFHKILNKNTKK